MPDTSSPALLWLIEDSAPYREAVQMVIGTRKDRFTLEVFISCEQAIKRIKQGTVPDVILLDVELPGMDGIEGIRHFKSLAPEVSLLMLTVFENDDKVFRAICAGASGYMLKSEPLPRIVEAVEQVIEGGAPMNPRIARQVLAMFTQMAPTTQDYGLSPREKEVLQLMVEGLLRKQIADRLKLSQHTITNFTRCIYRKLHVSGQTAAVSFAVRNKIVRS